MAAHAKSGLSPSGFKRTLHCPAWPRICKDLPRQETSEYAAEGSVAHHLAEVCLAESKDPSEFKGVVGWYNNGRCGLGSSDIALPSEKGKHFVFTIDDDMIDAVKVYLDEIYRKRAAAVGGFYGVEQKLSLEWLILGMFGTGDHLITEPLGKLYVDDYKHGKGVAVDVGEKVGDNSQLSIYALGALGSDNPNMVEEVVVTVIQPRANHPDGPIRSITYDVGELYDWGKNVLKPAADAIDNPKSKAVTGEWCRWCPAQNALDKNSRYVCPARRAETIKAAEVMFGDSDALTAKKLNPPDPTKFDADALDRAMGVVEIIEAHAKAIRTEAYRRLQKGEASAPKKWKLVAGKLSNRAWKDEADVYGQLKTTLPRKDVILEKIASPAAIEKALKKIGPYTSSLKTKVNDMCKERKPGKPAMVPIDNPKPALPSTVDQLFGE